MQCYKKTLIPSPNYTDQKKHAIPKSELSPHSRFPVPHRIASIVFSIPCSITLLFFKHLHNSMASSKRSWEGHIVNHSSNPSVPGTADTAASMAATTTDDNTASAFQSVFENFRSELDEHHDRRERVIKASRDITALSKKMCVMLFLNVLFVLLLTFDSQHLRTTTVKPQQRIFLLLRIGKILLKQKQPTRSQNTNPPIHRQRK